MRNWLASIMNPVTDRLRDTLPIKEQLPVPPPAPDMMQATSGHRTFRPHSVPPTMDGPGGGQSEEDRDLNRYPAHFADVDLPSESGKLDPRLLGPNGMMSGYQSPPDAATALKQQRNWLQNSTGR